MLGGEVPWASQDTKYVKGRAPRLNRNDYIAGRCLDCVILRSVLGLGHSGANVDCDRL